MRPFQMGRQRSLGKRKLPEIWQERSLVVDQFPVAALVAQHPQGRFAITVLLLVYDSMAKQQADQWRNVALRHLPQFEKIIGEAESHVDLWQLFKEVLSETGMDKARRAETASIYDYAWWCVTASRDPDMIAEVETFFYEDLPVYSDFEEQLARFISPTQFERLESSFKYRLSDVEYATFRSNYMKNRDVDSV